MSTYYTSSCVMLIPALGSVEHNPITVNAEPQGTPTSLRTGKSRQYSYLEVKISTETQRYNIIVPSCIPLCNVYNRTYAVYNKYWQKQSVISIRSSRTFASPEVFIFSFIRKNQQITQGCILSLWDAVVKWISRTDNTPTHWRDI